MKGTAMALPPLKGQAEEDWEATMSIIGEELQEFILVGAKKVDFFKVTDNGQWWQTKNPKKRPENGPQIWQLSFVTTISPEEWEQKPDWEGQQMDVTENE